MDRDHTSSKDPCVLLHLFNFKENHKIRHKDALIIVMHIYRNEESLAVYTETKEILMQLVSKFLTPEVSAGHTTHTIPAKIIESLNYILTNLHEDLSVCRLASMVHQNVDYFSRQFKKYTGMRPVVYICQKRIERAQYLMATNQMTLSEICNKIGFENLAYFSNTFKKVTGISPSDYKKQLYAYSS